MPLELMRGFQDRTGLKILEGYGLTEGTCVSTVNPPQGERRFGSIGLRVPLQAMKVVVLDEAGTYVRPELVLRVGQEHPEAPIDPVRAMCRCAKRRCRTPSHPGRPPNEAATDGDRGWESSDEPGPAGHHIGSRVAVTQIGRYEVR